MRTIFAQKLDLDIRGLPLMVVVVVVVEGGVGEVVVFFDVVVVGAVGVVVVSFMVVVVVSGIFGVGLGGVVFVIGFVVNVVVDDDGFCVRVEGVDVLLADEETLIDLTVDVDGTVEVAWIRVNFLDDDLIEVTGVLVGGAVDTVIVVLGVTVVVVVSVGEVDGVTVVVVVDVVVVSVVQL